MEGRDWTEGTQDRCHTLSALARVRQAWRQRGWGRPETFAFLGFTHVCAWTQTGHFTVLRQTMRKRWQAKLQELKAEPQRRRHASIPKLRAYFRPVVGGYVRCYGVPLNSRAIHAFRWAVGRLWKRALERRSQRTRVAWARMRLPIDRWLPPARVFHPYPLVRLGVVTQGGSRMR